MLKTALVLIAAVACAVLMLLYLTGCSSPPRGPSAGWSQAPEFAENLEPHLRGDMDRWDRKAGLPESGARWNVQVHYCPADGRQGKEGGYTCNQACSGVNGCVHAWALFLGNYRGEEMFAGTRPTRNTVEHEAFHLWLDQNAAYDHPSGHPDEFWIGDRRYKTRSFISSNVRWPLGLDRGPDWIVDRIRTRGGWSATMKCGYGGGD